MTNYRIIETRSLEELHTWCRLRQSVYVDAKLLAKSELSGKIHIDRYDAHAQHFLAIADSGEPVGTVRLILRGDHDQRLKVEDTHELVLPASSAEGSAITVLPGHRTRLVTAALMRVLFERMRELELENFYGEGERWCLDSMTKFGYPLREIGEPRFTYNAENIPLHIPTADFWRAVADAIESRPESLMGSYYSHPWEWCIGPQHREPPAPPLAGPHTAGAGRSAGERREAGERRVGGG